MSKIKIKKALPRVLAMLVCCWLESGALAQLTATVQPGYTFTSGEVPTTGKLNQLGQPVILISGTVSGSTGLSANSVNGSLLTDNLPDGVTLDYFTGISPRQLEVKVGGIYFTQLNASAFSFGLRGGQTRAVFVYAGDFLTNTIFHTNAGGIVDSIVANSIPANSFSGVSNTVLGTAYSGVSVFGTNLNLSLPLTVDANANLVITGFISTNVVLPSFTGVKIVSIPHLLPATPRTVRWVLQCQTADLAYSVGDEIDCGSFDVNQAPAFSWGGNSTNVWLTVRGSSVTDPGGGLSAATPRFDTGVNSAITRSRWRAKCYAFP